MLDHTQLRDRLGAMQKPLLSLYLHVDNARRENQAETPAWKIEQKNALREVSADVQRLDRVDQWEQIEKQMDTFFLDYLPTGRSLVVFADGEHIYTYELPFKLASQAHFGEALTLPLLWVIDEYEPYLIVQVDSEQARFIKAYLGEAEAAGEMQLQIDDYDFRQKRMMPALNSTQATGGTDRDGHDKTVQAHVQRFYNDVIAEIRRLQAEMGKRRVIISGDEQAAHALHDQMSQAGRQAVVGVAAAPLSLNDGEVLGRLLDMALTYEREQENALVHEIINAARAGGRGAVGAADVIEALTQSRVELLVLPYPPREDNLANDLIQQAFEAGTPIELVHGAPADALEDAGGVGAKLYYAFQTEATGG